MEGFGDRRAAARAAIERIGGEPVMAEDFTANGNSPRNACLDGVASADVCVVIVGARGGWRAPSGKLVVEEEYDEAVRRNMLISMYVEDVVRDAEAEALVVRLSDYVRGHFRTTYRTPEELTEVMARHLPGILKPLSLPMTAEKELIDRLSHPFEVQNQTTVRLVVAPERNEEVIDRVEIGRPEFLDNVLAIGHMAPGKVFDYRASKEDELVNDALVIIESIGSSRRRTEPSTRMEITPEGVVAIDKIVSPADRDDGLDMGGTFYLVRGDVEGVLTTMFAFVARFFETVDRFQRHQRFIYGAAFTGIGFRTLVDRIEKRSSYSMATEVNGAVVLEKPRIIARNILSRSQEEVARILTLLERRMKKP
jgi:hypothetical protein